jgi:hypothetical protein
VDVLFPSIKGKGFISEPVRPRVNETVRLIGLAVGLCTLLALSINSAAAQGMEGLGKERLHRNVADLQCVGCHQGEGTVPRLAVNPRTGEFHDVTILFYEFGSADHGEMACKECHGKGFGRFPHFPPREMFRCMDCHPRKEAGALEDEKYEFERIQEEFEKTVHVTEIKKDDDEDVKNNLKKIVKEFTCEECHDPHYFKATVRLEAPQQILDEHNGPCLICHRAGATGPLADAAEPDLVAVHDYLPRPRPHLDKTRCVDCHTNIHDTVAHDLPSGEEADDCVSCHSQESIMMSRHYRYGADPNEKKFGFVNGALLEYGYVMGATRHVLSDYGSYLLWGIGGLFVMVHGMARVVVRVRRRGRSLAASEPVDDRST